MVCGDPATGERSGPEPLLTLAAFRRERAAINFGVLLGAATSAGNGAAADPVAPSGAQSGVALQAGGGGGGGGSSGVLSVGTLMFVQPAASPHG